MKNNTNQLFITLGIILLIFLIIGIYFFTSSSDVLESNPTSVRTQSEDTTSDTETVQNDNDSITGEVSSGGFELSSAQVEALVSLGIDPADVPSTVSAEQETCFIGALGEERVMEIKAGDVPNAIEFVRARSCI